MVVLTQRGLFIVLFCDGLYKKGYAKKLGVCVCVPCILETMFMYGYRDTYEMIVQINATRAQHRRAVIERLC